jgi:hypothetical protein
MKRKKTITRCTVCFSPYNGAGITSENGIHICFDCAEIIYDVMSQFHKNHLDHCGCGRCNKGLSQNEYDF